MDHAHTTPTPCEPERGFTLIETAVVLFIVGLLMSGIVAFVNAMVANRQTEATKTNMEAIKASLITFISRNNRLPCPALATLADGANSNGVEAATPGTCTGIPTSGTGANTVVTGVVPWVTLGLPIDTARDAYGNRFTYQVVRAATNLTSSTISGLTGRITVHSAGLGALGAAPTGNQINDCSGGATTNPCASVVVIISHGSDGYGAYTRSGSQIAFDTAVTGNDARENANGDSMFVIKDFSGTTTNPFDDLVMALTPSDLLSGLIIGGSMKDAMGALRTTFEIMKAGIQAYSWQNSTITTCSGIPCRRYTLPSCGSPCSLSFLASSQKTDPWGYTITYTNQQNYIDCSDNPDSNAFLLRSPGPDGVSGNSDDVTQQVLAGELQVPLNKQGCAL